MDNPFKYSNTNLRYHSLSYYYKNKYKTKVSKIALDADFTCPNRDGKAGFGGCSFCSSAGSGEFAGDSNKTIMTQYNNVKARMQNKWPDSKTVPYFQAYTSTYGPLSKIKEMVEPFLLMDEVVAIDIATRPDCLEDDVIEYLDSLTGCKDIWIELGLQTIHDQIARDFNRGYDFDVFVDTVKRLAKTKIKVCVHLINGLPNESMEMMVESAKVVSSMDIDAVKIHMLHLVKDSRLGQQYLKKPFKILSKDEYVDIVASQLEVIPKEIIIQRLTGDAKAENLIVPKWTLSKFIVMNDIQKELVKRDSYQGRLA
ncbi:MAG TPA: TIGR01212 family radical SAM protein [Erysipelotrichaceae bacterium]|nr:TIGR01212 family radical SAM protein [Erysipelotrichaceae bacterium]